MAEVRFCPKCRGLNIMEENISWLSQIRMRPIIYKCLDSGYTGSVFPTIDKGHYIKMRKNADNKD